MGHSSELTSARHRRETRPEAAVHSRERARWIFVSGGRRGGEKREWVVREHHGEDDRVKPRGLSHPILSFNEQRAAKD